jgi:hypothetical protein
MRGLAVVVVVLGCGGKHDAPIDKQAVVDKPAPADAAPAAPVGPLVMVKDDGGFPFTLGIAFDGNYPQLPAVNPDGTLVAVFESNATGPMPIPPMSLVIESFEGGRAPEKVEILDETSAEAASQVEDWVKTPAAAPVIKTMRSRADAVLARLRKGQFGSLVAVDFQTESSGDKKPATIGDVILTSKDSSIETEPMRISLTDAKGVELTSEVLAPYTSGTFNSGMDDKAPCWYRPLLGNAYTDAAKRHLFLDVRFHWHEDCGPPGFSRWLVWDLAVARAAPAARAAVDSVVAAELVANTKTGIVASPHGTPPAIPVDTRRVTLARDGNTAWGSVASKDWRASFVVVNTTGWRVDSAMWSQGVADSVVNAKAKAKTLPALDPLTGDPGDSELRAAFVAMTKQGLDDIAALRPNLVGIGSAPGEQTTTGDILARGWNAAWKGHVTITSIAAHLAPSKTTGSVVATVSLAKPGGYSVPFMLFCVFDQQSDGTWSLVHIHFAV